MSLAEHLRPPSRRGPRCAIGQLPEEARAELEAHLEMKWPDGTKVYDYEVLSEALSADLGRRISSDTISRHWRKRCLCGRDLT